MFFNLQEHSSTLTYLGVPSSSEAKAVAIIGNNIMIFITSYQANYATKARDRQIWKVLGKVPFRLPFRMLIILCTIALATPPRLCSSLTRIDFSSCLLYINEGRDHRNTSGAIAAIYKCDRKI